jgi:hypothetical protein
VGLVGAGGVDIREEEAVVAAAGDHPVRPHRRRFKPSVPFWEMITQRDGLFGSSGGSLC